jgi:hypothetical protein
VERAIIFFVMGDRPSFITRENSAPIRESRSLRDSSSLMSLGPEKYVWSGPRNIKPIDEAKDPIARELQRACHDTLPWLISFSLGEEVYPLNSKITPAQLSPGVLYPGTKSKALFRIIILGALIAAFVNVRGAQGTVR